jgi:hypothetical protein
MAEWREATPPRDLGELRVEAAKIDLLDATTGPANEMVMVGWGARDIPDAAAAGLDPVNPRERAYRDEQIESAKDSGAPDATARDLAGELLGREWSAPA